VITEPVAVVLRSLLSDRSTAALATLDQGRPAVSMIPFAIHVGPAGLRLVSHVSGLAAHTRQMQSVPEVALLVTAAEGPDLMPQALARVSIPARAEFIPREHADHATFKATYLVKFPDAISLFQLGDFSLVAFIPDNVRLVAGFGRAVTLPPEAVLAAVRSKVDLA
jgi:putative heme iron utilization protein